MIDRSAVAPGALAMRRWAIRRVLLAILAAAILAAVGLHNAGYALLIGSGGTPADVENAPANSGPAADAPTKTGMVRLRCTYFTGTEKVITHIWRSADSTVGAGRCPLTIKLDGIADGDQDPAP